jgi:hypothetical protein
MGVLLVTCPVTGKEFSTGLLVDKDSLSAFNGVESSAHCPYCKTTHKWHPREARYVDAIPPQDWVENHGR